MSTVAEICRHDGEPARAGEFYARSREVLEALLSALPVDGLLRGRLASVLGREAGTVEDVGKRDQAVRGLEKALAMAESAFRSSPAAAPVRETLTDLLWNLARLLRERDEPEPATGLDRRRISLWTGSTAEDLLTLAAKQAARATSSATAYLPSPRRVRRVRRIERDQATSTLSLALSRGPRDLSNLMANPDLRALFARPEIQALLCN